MDNFQMTKQILKDMGLLKDSDYVIVCSEAPSASAGAFGAIGAAISASKKPDFILSANGYEIKLFDVDKKTGEYQKHYTLIPKNDIIKLKAVNGFFGKQIFIKTDKIKIQLTFVNNYKGHEQKIEVIKAIEFLQENYKDINK